MITVTFVSCGNVGLHIPLVGKCRYRSYTRSGKVIGEGGLQGAILLIPVTWSVMNMITHARGVHM